MRAKRELRRGKKIKKKKGNARQTAKDDDVINTGGLKVYTRG